MIGNVIQCNMFLRQTFAILKKKMIGSSEFINIVSPRHRVVEGFTLNPNILTIILADLNIILFSTYISAPQFHLLSSLV